MGAGAQLDTRVNSLERGRARGVLHKKASERAGLALGSDGKLAKQPFGPLSPLCFALARQPRHGRRQLDASVWCLKGSRVVTSAQTLISLLDGCSYCDSAASTAAVPCTILTCPFACLVTKHVSFLCWFPSMLAQVHRPSIFPYRTYPCMPVESAAAAT